MGSETNSLNESVSRLALSIEYLLPQKSIEDKSGEGTSNFYYCNILLQ